ncbi:uncharacterized protein LOC107021946 [Solanum pennellii]|uniref:Uncharacterized protein LOC107021946 n=1 Tax=Solanum pennellii TaxID=28526 RepID=A0ABM1GZG5_SOLPN|nr:uncharacterized protein LOC107021946 [Solanum pennellii]
MKTLFKSQEVLELVEEGFVDLAGSDEEAEKLKEIIKKDAKALFLIQQAVPDTIFSRIAATTTSSKAWKIVKKEFQCSAKSYGEDISEETVVAKVLRSLTPKFEHIFAAIEESHDLSDYTFDELMSSLQDHEKRLLWSHEKNKEKALQVKGESTHRKDKLENIANRCRGRGGFRGRGHGRGQGRSRDRGGPNEEKQWTFSCHYCRNQVIKKFIVGINRRMRITKQALQRKMMMNDLDESQKYDVRLGDNKKIKVEGEGTVSIMTSQGNAKILEDVMCVPSLSNNLLSIGQLMISGYSISFDDGVYTFKNKKFGKTIAKVPMTNNKMFSLEVSTVEKCVMVASGDDETKLWNLRYGHLNVMRQSGCRLKTHRTDRGAEFMAKEFSSFCEENGIHKDLTTPYTPEKISVAERKNRTVVEMGRSMMEVISRFMHNPSKLHLGAAKRVLRCIAGIDHGIWYSKVTDFTLTGFTDSDYMGNIDDRKSTSGFLFNLGSGAISWSSKKQEVVAL